MSSSSRWTLRRCSSCWTLQMHLLPDVTGCYRQKAAKSGVLCNMLVPLTLLVYLWLPPIGYDRQKKWAQLQSLSPNLVTQVSADGLVSETLCDTCVDTACLQAVEGSALAVTLALNLQMCCTSRQQTAKSDQHLVPKLPLVPDAQQCQCPTSKFT